LTILLTLKIKMLEKFENNLLKAALLGTRKKAYMPDFQNDHAEHQPLFSHLEQIWAKNQDSPEMRVLRLANSLHYYKMTGYVSEKINTQSFDNQAIEENFSPRKSAKFLKEFLQKDLLTLAAYWLSYCNKKGMIVCPELLPDLLDKAMLDEQIHVHLLPVGGQALHYMIKHNTFWNEYFSLPTFEQWEKYKFVAKKARLRLIRRMQPALARDWIAQVWDKESTAHCLDYLEILLTNLSQEDLPFVEQQLQHKNQKIRILTFELMRRIPTSSLVLSSQDALDNGCFEIVNKSLRANTEEVLVHLANYNFPNEVPIPYEDLTDNASAMLFAVVPLETWTAHFDLSPKEFIGLVLHKNSNKKFASVLRQSVLIEKNATWADALLTHLGNIDDELIALLSPQMRMQRYMELFEKNKHENYHLNRFLDLLTNAFDFEWDKNFTAFVLKLFITSDYYGPKAKKFLHFLPNFSLEALPFAEKMLQDAPNGLVQLKAEEIIKYFFLKKALIESFEIQKNE